MKHRRGEIEEKQTKSPSGRGERSKENKNAHGDRANHPEKAREDVSFIDVSQTGNDTEHHCDQRRSLCLPRFVLRRAPNRSGRSVPRLSAEDARNTGTAFYRLRLVRAGRLAHPCTPPSYLPKVTSRIEFVKQTEFRITVADCHALMDLRRGHSESIRNSLGKEHGKEKRRRITLPVAALANLRSDAIVTVYSLPLVGQAFAIPTGRSPSQFARTGLLLLPRDAQPCFPIPRSSFAAFEIH